jgi:hypothetical protein
VVIIYFRIPEDCRTAAIRQNQPANARRVLIVVRAQILYELSPKFLEIFRPDRLPHASHGVKEECQIVVGQKDTCEHLAG